MIYLIAGLLITFACYMLFLVSDKQRPKTQKSRWAKCAEHYQICRYLAFGVLAVALILLIQFTGRGVGSVSLFVFATPILFILILSINDLKPKRTAQSK
ncbi:hypothetical protein [Acinetobacter johnsonii]|uniref:DUF1634 domain-containing protein n=1 Tax=Acinetobacter johnsonii TaxID=40214 RepID=A0A2W5AJQ1_ACIJO|nr:hypothetical protein [Acinetobacter johnsonii]MDH2048357.1 hypothetical protein [Acinetobacter johnsonii]PZO94900.1 MAG: hypothetical protein DI631_03840 [Acinetobacter johnsonii]QQV08914.1 hypothetical protein I6I49_15915 [Acinetobacter johnsonii]RSE25070.1 hypothetical protein EGT73_04940 [Acinetobacter johnsonii]